MLGIGRAMGASPSAPRGAALVLGGGGGALIIIYAPNLVEWLIR